MLSSAFLLGVVEKNKTKQNKKERKYKKENNNNKSNKKTKKKHRNLNSQSDQRYTPNPFSPKREDYLFSLHSITTESNIKVMKIN